MLYWFAAQQQTSRSRRQKFDLFYLKFSAEFNELSLKFLKRQEVAKTWLELKQSRKPQICGIRGLRVNGQVKTPREARKRVPLSFYGSFSPTNAERLTIKAFLK